MTLRQQMQGDMREYALNESVCYVGHSYGLFYMEAFISLA